MGSAGRMPYAETGYASILRIYRTLPVTLCSIGLPGWS